MESPLLLRLPPVPLSLYATGVNTFASVATTSLSVNNGLTISAGNGYLVGGEMQPSVSRLSAAPAFSVQSPQLRQPYKPPPHSMEFRREERYLAGTTPRAVLRGSQLRRAGRQRYSHKCRWFRGNDRSHLNRRSNYNIGHTHSWRNVSGSKWRHWRNDTHGTSARQRSRRNHWHHWHRRTVPILQWSEHPRRYFLVIPRDERECRHRHHLAIATPLRPRQRSLQRQSLCRKHHGDRHRHHWLTCRSGGSKQRRTLCRSIFITLRLHSHF